MAIRADDDTEWVVQEQLAGLWESEMVWSVIIVANISRDVEANLVSPLRKLNLVRSALQQTIG